MGSLAAAHDVREDIAAIARAGSVPTILDVICRTTGMGFAVVARVTDDRWVACRVLDTIRFGLEPGGELAIDNTFCRDIRLSRVPLVIDNVAEHPEYCGHAIPAMYGFQSYISVPIIQADGRFFGTLCAVDPRPARLDNPETIGMFKLFAELIASQLDSDEQLQKAAAALQREQRLSTLREQFIAVLGHDLRNPLAAISGGIAMVGRTRLDDKAVPIVPMIQSSVARMSSLIDDVLDFARGRLGDGLAVTLTRCDLSPALAHVVTELRTSHPDRVVETAFTLDHPVMCDPARISQLLSNLVANALTYGAPDKPVVVNLAPVGDHGFELSVSNQGDPIPPLTLDHLFEPFQRGAVKPNQQGLGLGLYIAAQIAKAHGGTLTAASSPAETRFTFRMPATAG